MNRLPTQISSMAGGGGNHYIIEVQYSVRKNEKTLAQLWFEKNWRNPALIYK